MAARTKSDLVVGMLGSPADRRAATARVAAALPPELRETFGRAGRLVTDRVRTS
ncbi:hypothetical protein TOK_1546 [Pseudonocardia sp. N23]|nr:hypothetical protein TOK_1546 [Pseudonocardia sp. N23]